MCVCGCVRARAQAGWLAWPCPTPPQKGGGFPAAPKTGRRFNCHLRARNVGMALTLADVGFFFGPHDFGFVIARADLDLDLEAF